MSIRSFFRAPVPVKKAKILATKVDRACVCSRCNDGIHKGDIVIEEGGSVFHPVCFLGGPQTGPVHLDLLPATERKSLGFVISKFGGSVAAGPQPRRKEPAMHQPKPQPKPVRKEPRPAMPKHQPTAAQVVGRRMKRPFAGGSFGGGSATPAKKRRQIRDSHRGGAVSRIEIPSLDAMDARRDRLQKTVTSVPSAFLSAPSLDLNNLT